MILKAYTVVCDGNRGRSDLDRHAAGCDQVGGTEETAQRARRVAKREGWARIVGNGRWDSRDLSPQCAAREEADR